MNDLETNADKVYERFSSLGIKEMRSSLKAGMRAAMAKVRKEARGKLRASVNNSSKRTPRFTDTLQSGVRTGRVNEDKDGEITGSVLITSRRTPGSGSFRLKIIERGTFRTGQRYAKTWNGKPLKKPRRTGSISATNFFSRTRDEKGQYFQQEMTSAINKSIDKINSTK